MDGLIGSVPTFVGKQDGYEDPLEYLETINMVVEEAYKEVAKQATIKRLSRGKELKESTPFKELQRATITMTTTKMLSTDPLSIRLRVSPSSVGLAVLDFKSQKIISTCLRCYLHLDQIFDRWGGVIFDSIILLDNS